METVEGRLCISQAELLNGIATLPTINGWVRTGKVCQVRRGCRGQAALYAVESLPEAYRRKVMVQYPADQAEVRSFADRIEVDSQAVLFYSQYVLADGRHLTPDKIAECVNNCSILKAFGNAINAANSQRMRQSKKRLNLGEFWKKAAGILPQLEARWGNSLPINARRLKDKYDDFCKEGYHTFISRKYNNNNAGKVYTEQQQALLQTLLSHHNNLDCQTVSDYYNAVATEQGWDTITASAVGVWLKKLDLEVSAARLGANRFRAERAMQHKRQRPACPFAMWTLDGWTAELFYQATTTDRNGHSVTTYHNRLCIVAVIDTCCNYPIGYAIGLHESPALITEALRNAVNHASELFGSRYLPFQLQSDNYAVASLHDVYNIISGVHIPAKVGNAKAKVVEPYFGYLNKTYCKRYSNWSGYGVTTDPRRQPNPDRINIIKKDFPDIEGVTQQLVGIMNEERRTKIAEMRARHANRQANNQPELLTLSQADYLYYFGQTTGRTNAMEPAGLMPTLLGKKRVYDCFDINFRRHTSERWTVKYDPNDLSQVLAVNETGELRYLLEEKYIQPMALVDRGEGDAAALARVNHFNQQLEQYVKDDLYAKQAIAADLLYGNPELDVLKRLLITDSRGQHKNHREQARIQPLLAEVEEVPVASPKPTTENTTDFSIF